MLREHGENVIDTRNRQNRLEAVINGEGNKIEILAKESRVGRKSDKGLENALRSFLY